MSLFKVCPNDRSKKIMIKAGSLVELIEKSIKKLEMADGAYKVALEDDGTEVDDDEILSDLAKLSVTAVNLMLLPEHVTWQPLSKTKTTTELEGIPSTRTLPTNQHDEDKSSPQMIEIVGNNIWQRFPKRLMESCQNQQRAFEADRRSMVAAIADYMAQDLKDFSRRTAERIAKTITDKYPKTFSDLINQRVVGSGMESLRQQIYNAVDYRKIDKEHKRRAEMRLSDETAIDDPGPELRKPNKQDEYGCTEYQPLLPATETTTSQSEKKQQLVQFFASDNKEIEKISQMMNETYPTQRMEINKQDRNLEQLFKVWPYLQMPKYLSEHASRLLGKPVQTIWEESLTANAKSLRRYTIYVEKSKKMKARQTKSACEELQSESHNTILGLISEAKATSIAAKSEIALLAITFPLIAHHLKEEPKYLFKIIPEDIPIDDVVEYAKQGSPILIIRGKSLFDTNAKCDVVLEEKMRIAARGVLDGFLVTFLAYYVFGYIYQPEIQKTLEFIQRVLLQINPASGHKRKDTKKRKSLSYDNTVMKLANAVEAFKED